MSEYQKLAVLILRCFAIIIVFWGLCVMALGVHPYPRHNPSYFEAGLFVLFLIFKYSIPGIILYVTSRTIGKFIGSSVEK